MASRVLQKGKNRITQGYKDMHRAVDLGREHITGEPVIAHTAGVVVFCQTGHKNNKGSTGNASYGNCVRIDHGSGYSTLYAHLNAVKVKLGETVKQGQVIGTMGNTGNSYGMHLHFELRKGTARIDPTPFLNADLPLPIEEKNRITYKVYTDHWLPEVTDYNNKNANGYAGVAGKNMTALMAKADKGTVRLRVHLCDEKRWLPWVDNELCFAGNLGQKIDAVQMQLQGVEGYEVRYRVSPTKGTKWYGWCVGLTDKTGDGYAGVFGNPIDCIQCEIVKVDK